jgi:hypothetical protein
MEYIRIQVTGNSDAVEAVRQLLSAAPELLEALENARIALSFYRGWMADHSASEAHGSTTYPFGIDCEAKARAAIAKARGEK